MDYYKLGQVIGTADGGCNVCVRRLLNEFNKKFELNEGQRNLLAMGASYNNEYETFIYDATENEFVEINKNET